MSLEKIIEGALNNKPLEVKEAFEAEVAERIAGALEEKYKKAMKENGDEDEDDDDDDDEDEDDDEDDEDDDDKNESYSKEQLETFVESLSDEELDEFLEAAEELEEGPFKGVGKMLMKRKLAKTKAKAGSDWTKHSKAAADTRDPSARKSHQKSSDAAGRMMDRTNKAIDRLNRPDNTPKYGFNKR
jgi:hypothetical protein